MSTAPLVAVKVLQLQTEKSVLVDWDGRRVVIPREALEGDHVPANVLEAGIEYGEPWAEVVTVNVTRAKIAEALHAAGVWTYQDVLRMPTQVMAVFRHAMDVDLQALFGEAKEKVQHE